MVTAFNSINASAPGSIMLLGEYSVLHNGHALVCAVDKRMRVSLTPRIDEQIELISALGIYQTTLQQLEIIAPFQFVLAVLKQFQNQLKSGCTITIESEFSEQVGLASSAAVTVATITALATWLGITYTPLELIYQAREIVRTVQGLGSGADVAACVLGGLVNYCQEPLTAEKLEFNHPLTLVYSGSKTPTAVAVKKVTANFADQPAVFKELLQGINNCAQQGIKAVRHNDELVLAQMMNQQQKLMQALGVNTPVLESIVNNLRAESSILGAKISGSGLGDCVVAVGTLTERHVLPAGTQNIPIQIASQGVLCEKN